MSNYWKQRIEEEMKAKQAQDAQIGDELKRLHQHHMRNIQLEIDGFLAQYGANNQLTPVEVKKRVSEMDVVAFQEKAKRYVDEKNFSKQANDELALYNLKMKVSRLEMLQYHMDLEMVALADSEMKLTEKFLNAEFIQEMNLQAGILGEVIPKPRLIQGMAQGIINTPYEGAVWSERIWQRQTKLRKVVAAMTTETLLRGRNATTMVSDIQKMFDVSAYEAKRLAVTETARIQTAVHKEMYGVNEIDEYEYLAEPGACKVCAALNGKTFKVSEMEPGKNASPMHPHCHCSDAPNVSELRKEMEKTNQTKYSESYTHSEQFLKAEKRQLELDELDSKINELRESKSPSKYTMVLSQNRDHELEVIEDLFFNGKIGEDEYEKRLRETTKKWNELIREARLNGPKTEIEQLQAEYSTKRMWAYRENANDLKDYLSQYRDVGLGELQKSDLISNPKSNVANFVVESMNYLPTDWLESSANTGKFAVKSTARGYYSHVDKELSIGNQIEQFLPTGIHEMMHRFERTHPGLLEIEKQFYDYRTKNESLVKLRDITKNTGFKDNETTRVDNFINPYMGKDYNETAYELLSMGVEMLYTNPIELRKDPEMFEWVLNVLINK